MTAAEFSRPAPAEVCWGEPTPFEHSLQVYASKDIFLDALEGFVCSGLKAGDGVIVIAEAAHRRALERRLRRRGVDVGAAQSDDRYIPLDAADTLALFMHNGRPDEARFQQVAQGVLARARGLGRPVRAFGEMVALLWHQGNRAATLRLESLWNKVCAEESLRLFCAYPETCFAGDHGHTLAAICSEHSREIDL